MAEDEKSGHDDLTNVRHSASGNGRARQSVLVFSTVGSEAAGYGRRPKCGARREGGHGGGSGGYSEPARIRRPESARELWRELCVT